MARLIAAASHRTTRIVLVLVSLLALGTFIAKPAFADIAGCSGATGGMSGTGPGQTVNGKVGTTSYSPWAGVIKVDLTGTTNDTIAFCIDLTHHISTGDCFNAGAGLTGNLAKALYYYPPDLNQSNAENAARQAVVWHFSDNFDLNTSDSVYARYSAILTDLAAQPAPPSVNPPVLTITPTSNLVNVGTTQQFTLTLTKDGSPVANQQITLSMTGVGSISTTSVTTNSSGQAQFTGTSNTYGTMNVNATTPYSLPAGTEFDPVVSGQQKLVLGQTKTGNLNADAVIKWKSPTAVTIASFTAKQQGKNVKLRWQTGIQSNLAGFNVLRQTGKGAWQKINTALIPIDNPGNVTGASYAFTDKYVTQGKTYRYKLEILEINAPSASSDIVKITVK